MSTLNNGIATYQDIIDNGGLIHALEVDTDRNMCVRAKDIISPSLLNLQSFANTSFNTSVSYTDENKLVKYNDINIAETGTIYLGVDYLNTYSNYTIDGVIVKIHYPNESMKSRIISVYNATGPIPIENCVIGAKVSINTSTLSGAYVRLGSNIAGEITLISLFASGAKVTVTDFMLYPCFSITKKNSGTGDSSGGSSGGGVDPDIGDFTGGTVTATTTRTINVIVNNSISNVKSITIGTSTYASGTTATNFGLSSNMTLKKVSYQNTVPVGEYANTILTVPKDAYVKISMGAVSYSLASLSTKIGKWDSATKVVSPGTTSVTFTISPGVVEL